MRKFIDEQTLFDAQAESLATFTAVAATDVITSTAHGLVAGNAITVANSGGGLPGGLAANTIYYIITVLTDSFQVSLTPGGAAVDITSAGTGTHSWYRVRVSTSLMVQDFRHLQASIDIDSGANVTIFVLGSIADAAPNFLNPQSPTNRYEFIGFIDREDGLAIDGDTGIAFAANDNRLITINTDGLSWLCFRTRAHVDGAITVRAKGYQD